MVYGLHSPIPHSCRRPYTLIVSNMSMGVNILWQHTFITNCSRLVFLFRNIRSQCCLLSNCAHFIDKYVISHCLRMGISMSKCIYLITHYFFQSTLVNSASVALFKHQNLPLSYVCALSLANRTIPRAPSSGPKGMFLP